MLHRPFWTWRPFTGIVLILGGVLFLASAWIPLTLGPPTPLTDSKGTAIYLLPPQEVLGVVFHHQALWWWTNAFFMGSTLVTLLGLALLTTLLREAGNRIFSQLGLILFVLAATLWLIQRAVPLSIDPWAAQQMARRGPLPRLSCSFIIIQTFSQVCPLMQVLCCWAWRETSFHCCFHVGLFLECGDVGIGELFLLSLK